MAMSSGPSGLPMIKCSNCGLEISIEKLADHLCGPGGSTGRATPRNFNDAFANMSINQSVPALFKQKQIPRPIDSTVANVPFRNRPSAPTGFQSLNRADSPALGGRQNTFPSKPPVAPVRAPSPELILAQECAFPAFPIAQRPSTSRTVHDANGGIASAVNDYQAVPSSGFGASGYNTPVENPYSQQFSNYFGGNQTSGSGSTAARESSSSFTTPPSASDPFAASSINGAGTPSGRTTSDSRHKSVIAANRPLDEIGSFRTHRTAPSRNGLPTAPATPDIPRSASAQSHRYGRSVHENAPPVPHLQDANGHTILRSASAIGTRDRKIFDTPPLPLHLQHYRSESPIEPRHTPSDSASSNQSERSQPATSSSQSSPSTSNASMSPQRRGRQEAGRLYTHANRGLGIDGDTPIERTPPKSFSRPSYSQPKLPLLSPETFEQLSAGPWQSDFKKSTSQQSIPLNIDSVYHTNGPYRDNPPDPPAPESPLEPTFKNKKLPPLKMQSNLPPASHYGTMPQSAVMPNTRSNGIFQSSLEPSLMPQTTLRRAATTSKGKCRGCEEVIVGRSVSAADGRLTGRWHRQCFTCKTCSEPFPTMDFYVIGNDPYCNRHYHQLNKSLCSSCDRGIEGQYVDNDRQKFHPHCFTCSECHFILRDTYFDLNGKIFCERHAFKFDTAPSYGAGRRFPEKRSTRFMMI